MQIRAQSATLAESCQLREPHNLPKIVFGGGWVEGEKEILYHDFT